MVSTLSSRAWRAASTVMGTALLAACGGGGGSGGGSQAPSDVQVQLRSTAPITAEVMQSDAMPDITLSGAATGNFASLNGKTIYIVVEDPASLFQPRPSISGPFSNGVLNVHLTGRRLLSSGTFTGQLTVHACLDAACATELSGSPMRVPYDVKVLRGMEVSVETISVSSAFGDPPPRRSVSVRLPDKLKLWVVNNTTPYDPYSQDVFRIQDQASDATNANGSFALDLLPALPGVRQGEVTVVAVSLLNGREVHYTKKIPVTHAIADNPAVDFVFSPPRLDMGFKHGDALIHETPYHSVTKPGVLLTLRGVEYLSNPPAANGHRQVNAWFEGFHYSQSAVPCYSTIYSSDCLPPGTYTARVRYTMTKGSSTSDVYYPLTLQITP